jgi:myo-inositol-1(or 4)-monophosphatase
VHKPGLVTSRSYSSYDLFSYVKRDGLVTDLKEDRTLTEGSTRKVGKERLMKDLAIAAAKEAGKILMGNFGKIERVDTKDVRDLVSNVDIAAESKIIELIKAQYPDHGILCEESEEKTTDSEYKWIVDPLDGTHNYIYGIRIFGVSIALEYEGEIVLGVINLPYSGEIYLAEKGKGAYLNGKQIQVSTRAIESALVIYDSTLHTDKAIKTGVLDALVDRTFGLRISGSAVRNLTHIANGSADLVVEYSDKPWDFAAGGLMVEEAGGTMTTLDGDRWSPYIQGYLASNGKFHDQILQLLRAFRR